MDFKHILSFAAAALSGIFTAQAQNINDVEVTDLTMEIREGYINVDMSLDLTDLHVKGTQVVVLTPCIVNGPDTLMLKSIGVYGRNRRVFYQRNADARPTDKKDDAFKPSDIRGDIITYSTSADFMEWMDGCSLSVIRKDFGCCGKSDIISSIKLVDRFPMAPFIPELIYIRPEHEVQKTREISGTAYIDFPVSRTAIQPAYRNNYVELAKITGTIDSVRNDSDIVIKSVSIKGFASPESPYSNNEYLAKGRTAALKGYIQSLYHFPEGVIITSYEPEDWKGLEKYVQASSLPHRDEILETIRSDRDPDTKEWIIKSRWKDDYRHLLDHCYPALRHSDYVIEYTIRSYSDPKEIEEIFRKSPQKLSLEEFYLLSQTFEPGSEDFNELFETAVRMYPDDPAANLNAANAAILKKDYKRALRYLEKAADLPEAAYARGALEIFMEDNEAARSYLEQARKYGIQQAETALREIARNRMLYKMTNNK